MGSSIFGFAYSGNFSTIAVQCLQKLPSNSSKYTYSCDGRTFNFLLDDGFVFLVVADESMGRSVPFVFLERVKEDFKKCYVDIIKNDGLTDSFNMAAVASKMAILSPTCFFPMQTRSPVQIVLAIRPSKRVESTVMLGAKRSVSLQSTKVQVNASGSPNGPPPSSWQQWVLGLIIAVILPAIGYRRGLFSIIKGIMVCENVEGRTWNEFWIAGKVDRALETAEKVAEAVADVAETAEKIAEAVEENLPGDSKLKETLDSVEDVAKKIAQDAKITEEAIHKVKDVEEEIEENLDKPDSDDAKT